MPDTEEEILVTLEPDLFAIGGDGKAKAAGDPVGEVKDQFKVLQDQMERERQAREEADRRATLAAQEANRARKEATDARSEAVESQYGTVTSELTAAQAEATAAEQEYTAAFEKGDGPAMAAAQRKMARAEARAARLDEAKADLEARKKPETKETNLHRAEGEQRPSAADPVEAYIANRSEPTQKWLREHKEWITDPRKNSKLTAAHYSAQAENIAPDTPEYFEHVETFIGLRANGAGNGAASTANGHAKTRRLSVPAAPVHASGGGTSGGGREVRLTRGEAEAATDGTHVWNYDDPSGQKRFKKGDPIGIQEMARRKETLSKQGAYDRSFTES